MANKDHSQDAVPASLEDISFDASQDSKAALQKTRNIAIQVFGQLGLEVVHWTGTKPAGYPGVTPNKKGEVRPHFWKTNKEEWFDATISRKNKDNHWRVRGLVKGIQLYNQKWEKTRFVPFGNLKRKSTIGTKSTGGSRKKKSKRNNLKKRPLVQGTESAETVIEEADKKQAAIQGADRGSKVDCEEFVESLEDNVRPAARAYTAAVGANFDGAGQSTNRGSKVDCEEFVESMVCNGKPAAQADTAVAGANSGGGGMPLDDPNPTDVPPVAAMPAQEPPQATQPSPTLAVLPAPQECRFCVNEIQLGKYFLVCSNCNDERPMCDHCYYRLVFYRPDDAHHQRVVHPVRGGAPPVCPNCRGRLTHYHHGESQRLVPLPVPLLWLYLRPVMCLEDKHRFKQRFNREVVPMLGKLREILGMLHARRSMLGDLVPGTEQDRMWRTDCEAAIRAFETEAAHVESEIPDFWKDRRARDHRLPPERRHPVVIELISDDEDD